GRRWTKLIDCVEVSAWSIAWAPGAGLSLHDHGDAAAAITVVRGELREGYTDAATVGFRTRVLRAGSTVELGADHVHEIANVGRRAAVSIHVYAPALDDMTFYDEWPEALDLASSR